MTGCQVKAPKHVKCDEDDDFVDMFDKMMNDSLRETKASVPTSQQVEIVAPVHSRQNKKLYGEQHLQSKSPCSKLAQMTR